MGKLRLNIDDLKVQSFATAPDGSQGSRGTVQGYVTCTSDAMCCDYTEECSVCAMGPQWPCTATGTC